MSSKHRPSSKYNADMLILMVDNETGGGMFGLTTALKLHEQGKRTVVLEAHRVGMGVGGYSTAKLCSLQRIMFSIIQSKFSGDMVQSYGKMNQEGTPLSSLSHILASFGHSHHKGHVQQSTTSIGL